MKKLLITIVFCILLVSVYYSAPSISNVAVTPVNASSNQDITCYFNISGYTDYNISWYNGSTLFNISDSAISPWVLPTVHTRKTQEWNCTVFAYNATDFTSSIESAKITIKNTPPTTPFVRNSSAVDIGSDEVLLEGTQYTYTLVTSDYDGDSLTYFNEQVITGNDICDVSASTITCLENDEPDESQNDQLYFSVGDGTNGVGVYVSFNVTAVNDAPTFSTTIENKVVNETQTFSYPITVADEENATGPFSFSVESDFNPEFLEYITSDNITFTLRFINNAAANFSHRDNHTVNITACDPEDGSLCINNSFNLEVIPTNQPPTLGTVPDVIGNQTELFTLVINATDVDVSDSLNFTISSGCGYDIWEITTINTSYNNGKGLINMSMDNTHVICPNVTITVRDSVGQTDSASAFFNISNTNDPPVLNNKSYATTNTLNNIDISNITAYIDVNMLYTINGTDPDLLTYASDTLMYGDNSSLCTSCPNLNLDTSTGLINLTLNSSYIGNYTYAINVSDNAGIVRSAVLSLYVKNNSAPYFDPALENKSINESVPFAYDIDATDIDGDSFNFSDDSPLFDIDSNGLISFTPNCSMINNYTINITVSDDKGASTTDPWALEIINRPDAPELLPVDNITILEQMSYSLDVGSSTTDDDVSCVGDTLTYNVTFINGTPIFGINPSTGIISFTAALGSQDTYIANISVGDTFGFSDFVLWKVIIENRSNSPQIINVTPIGYPTSFGWADRPANNYTSINFTETDTINFSILATDIDGDQLLYNWTRNGAEVSSESNYTFALNYQSAGWHNITVRVRDNVSGILSNEVRMSWNTSIHNLNRLPGFNDSLPNVSLNGTALQIQNYLTGDGVTRTSFFDPDDDNLTYTHTADESIVTITFQGNSVTFTPVAVGEDLFNFTGADSTGNVTSNQIFLNVTLVPNESDSETTTTTTTTRSSSGSSSSSSSSPVPYSVIEEVEIEKQIYLDIINPGPAVIYRNNTLLQPITIRNSGNETIYGITLGASTNDTEAQLSFTNNYISELDPGEPEDTDLIIQSYKLLNNYEVVIEANVSDPEYHDSAVIYVNAVEKAQGNQSVVNTKITFARDLLSSNPECLELNEFLKRAQNHISRGEIQEASDILDSVVQGCKYLVSQSKLRDESPRGFVFDFDFSQMPYFRTAIITFVVLMAGAIVITIRAKKQNSDTN